MLLVLVFMFTLVQVKCEIEKKECTAKIGEKVNLFSPCERLERCHYVFIAENTGEQCCYNTEGKDQDCETSESTGSSCLKEGEYKMTNDGRETGTCNLTIDSLSEASAGRYRILSADDHPI